MKEIVREKQIQSVVVEGYENFRMEQLKPNITDMNGKRTSRTIRDVRERGEVTS